MSFKINATLLLPTHFLDVSRRVHSKQFAVALSLGAGGGCETCWASHELSMSGFKHPTGHAKAQEAANLPLNWFSRRLTAARAPRARWNSSKVMSQMHSTYFSNAENNKLAQTTQSAKGDGERREKLLIEVVHLHLNFKTLAPSLSRALNACLLLIYF